jgi:hypothetical protein
MSGWDKTAEQTWVGDKVDERISHIVIQESLSQAKKELYGPDIRPIPLLTYQISSGIQQGYYITKFIYCCMLIILLKQICSIAVIVTMQTVDIEAVLLSELQALYNMTNPEYRKLLKRYDQEKANTQRKGFPSQA